MFTLEESQFFTHTPPTYSQKDLVRRMSAVLMLILELSPSVRLCRHVSASLRALWSGHDPEHVTLINKNTIITVVSVINVKSVNY